TPGPGGVEMPHLIEPAPTGRAKCRGCDARIAAGELRFGEVVPNPFAEAEARLGLAHERLPRINGVERSPTSRAQCRSCKEPIPKDAWRIALVFYEEGRFSPAGYVHLGCCRAYFDTTDVLPRLRRFSPNLREEDVPDLQAQLEG